MTCIVGLREAGKVYIGGDSCGANEVSAREVTTPKVFTRGDYLFGCAGSYRAIQLLQSKLEIPKHEDGVDVYVYITNIFAEAVRQLFRDAGFSVIRDNNEEATSSAFLLGYAGRLFEVQEDFSAIEYADGIASIGSGSLYALGALRVAKGEPTERVEAALEAAAYYSPSVSAPFVVISGEWSE